MVPKSIVIIPTYNEKENIRQIITEVLSLDPNIDVLVVDDGSPDGTADIVRSLQAEQTRIHLITRQGKLGLGTAYITGFKWGLQRDYEYLIEMDADFSHPPFKVLELIEACEKNADLATSLSPGLSNLSMCPGSAKNRRNNSYRVRRRSGQKR